jgi:hypothetical protein
MRRRRTIWNLPGRMREFCAPSGRKATDKSPGPDNRGLKHPEPVAGWHTQPLTIAPVGSLSTAVEFRVQGDCIRSSGEPIYYKT